MMASRAGDCWRQGEADLAHARAAMAAGHYDWSCFAAQQSAEKAVKAVHQKLGRDAWGHSVTELLRALPEEMVTPQALELGRALDQHYIATRSPHMLPAGAPADLYTEREASRAIAATEAIIASCRRELSK